MNKIAQEYFRIKYGEAGWDLEITTDFEVKSDLYNTLSAIKHVKSITKMSHCILITTKDNVDISKEVYKALERYVRINKSQIDYYENYVEPDITDVISEIIGNVINFFKRFVNKFK